MFRWFVTPVFLGLALFNAQEPTFLCTAPGPFGFLGSMWFMYVVMAAVHAEPWARWLHRRIWAPASETAGA